MLFSNCTSASPHSQNRPITNSFNITSPKNQTKIFFSHNIRNRALGTSSYLLDKSSWYRKPPARRELSAVAFGQQVATSSPRALGQQVATSSPRALGQQVATCSPRALGQQVATCSPRALPGCRERYLLAESSQLAGSYLLAESSRSAGSYLLAESSRSAASYLLAESSRSAGSYLLAESSRSAGSYLLAESSRSAGSCLLAESSWSAGSYLLAESSRFAFTSPNREDTHLIVWNHPENPILSLPRYDLIC
ncbi:hypothetical protein PCANC_08721 [Puccinia coronata f. sp. avenae]|uniref:Uncharacterized protein n=1 Tax=Puccinia coronata f. sp. avenae TaxID=200324 RepID=A0A2N5VSA7_9BASI|nr:hypothetical protein PCANC_08721 [Puccinia coronata f. sp. avenae]